MKKSPKLQNGPKGGEVKPRQHGPLKEKTQITIRVDSDLMNEAYAQIKVDNTRITDIIERGIVLALTEARHELPAWTKQVRFMVANATREQQILIRGLCIAMVEAEPDADFFAGAGLSAPEAKWYESLKWYLETRNKQPHAEACLGRYSRYGKSPEEVAKLGKP